MGSIENKEQRLMRDDANTLETAVKELSTKVPRKFGEGATAIAALGLAYLASKVGDPEVSNMMQNAYFVATGSIVTALTANSVEYLRSKLKYSELINKQRNNY